MHRESLVYFDKCVEAIQSEKSFSEKELSLPYYGMGNAYFCMEKYSEAFSYYEKAYENDKSLDIALLGMAQSKQAAEEFKQSQKYLTKIKKPENLDNSSLHIFYELSAFAEYMQMNYEKAIEIYSTLIEKEDSIAYYYLLKGMSELWMNNEEESATSLQKAMELDTNDTEAYLSLAIWTDVFHDDEVEKIIYYTTKAIKKDDENADAYYLRAFIKTKNYDKNVRYKDVFNIEEINKDFEKAIAIDSVYYEVYYGMAYAYSIFYQSEKACQMYEKGKKLLALPSEFKFLKKKIRC
jgi:tetratricopeptide (TPR) repeat protein